MLEIQTLRESAPELAGFLQRVWRTRYEGSVPFPLWDTPELEWQFFDNRYAERNYLLGAYDGTQLVGTFLAATSPFSSPGHSYIGSSGSWLTVDPEYRGGFVAPQLINEMRRRHTENGAHFFLGFAFPSKGRMSLEFWSVFSKAFPQAVSLPLKMGLWVRVLDGKAFSKASLQWTERTLGWVLARGKELTKLAEPSEAVRPYEAGDLRACLALISSLGATTDLAYEWDGPRLAHQLEYRRISRTLVLEHEGRLAGYLNYHHQKMLAKATINTTIIDQLVCPDVPSRARRLLIEAGLRQMREEGAAVALALRLPAWPAASLLRCGFLPVNYGHRLVVVRTQPDVVPRISRNVYLHLR